MFFKKIRKIATYIYIFGLFFLFAIYQINPNILGIKLDEIFWNCPNCFHEAGLTGYAWRSKLKSSEAELIYTNTSLALLVRS